MRKSKVYLFTSLTVIFFLLYWIAYMVLTIPSENEILRVKECKEFSTAFMKEKPGYLGIWVPMSNIPSFFVDILVKNEDANFYTHRGIDWSAIRVAFQDNVTHGKYRHGGSTITMQLARNLFLTRKKTLTRKIKEMMIARRLERLYTKKEILEHYINVIEYGHEDNLGIYGLEIAMTYYFHKPLQDMSVWNAVRLVSIIPSPMQNINSVPLVEKSVSMAKSISNDYRLLERDMRWETTMDNLKYLRKMIDSIDEMRGMRFAKASNWVYIFMGSLWEGTAIVLDIPSMEYIRRMNNEYSDFCLYILTYGVYTNR